MSTIRNQLSSLMLELQLSHDKEQIIAHSLIALHTAELLLAELKTSHAIINNCLNNMILEQRLAVAIDNHIYDLSAQWAFRTEDRQRIITRGENILGGKQP